MVNLLQGNIPWRHYLLKAKSPFLSWWKSAINYVKDCAHDHDYSRFTKRQFVRDKNPQKLNNAYIIPFLFLNSNMDLLLKSIQLPPNGSQFLFQWLYALQMAVHHSRKTKLTCDVTKNHRTWGCVILD